IFEIDEKSVYNPNLSISEGGLFPWSRMADNINSWHMQLLERVANSAGFSLRTPLGKLNPEQLKIVLYGAGYLRYEGLIPNLTRRYQETESDYIRREIEQYMRELSCPECQGKRLKPEALAVTIKHNNIHELGNLPLQDFKKWLKSLNSAGDSSPENDQLTNQELFIVRQVLKEILVRIEFLLAVGLEYLNLNRNARSLSGGEAQRIRLASQIGTGLSGVLYVLDEPSIGLHQRDNQRLINTLQSLKQLGNTIIVVEHDQDTILAADHVIDIGPGAGEHGGEITASGTPGDIKNNQDSLTGQYLSGKKKIVLKDIQAASGELHKIINSYKTETSQGKVLKLLGAQHNNLKNIDVAIPLGKFVAVTGVSGSGKSSLINETLVRYLRSLFYNNKDIPGKFRSVSGIENIDKIIDIDQSPIGRTPRSNPATYTGIFTPVRELFSKTPEARSRGYKMGRFSFNVHGGRCEACQGEGLIKIAMQFLPDVYVTCETCQGKRYNRETLQIDYKGKNIADILEMTVETCTEFLTNIPVIRQKLATLNEVGLGYIKLGQQATTLSGGEAQRIKLASELSKRNTGKTLYVLDEPTTGLHFEDLCKLLIVLHSLVAKGNTVLVIEHNLDLIKTADWIIDLGPEGGEQGGEIVAEGTPVEISNHPQSYTGKWLKKYL
ncbi:MAG TPA: excinuclease ABC subunit UvrA, partial [Candidatus Dojkabacteria bacterium]|nr:excinuclease ABC subunit UvrA [Candidatus Dojkabacteria bacterium]